MSQPTENTNGWPEWKNHVLMSLERIEKNQNKLTEEVTSLKAKAAVWGAVGGTVLTSIVNIIISSVR